MPSTSASAVSSPPPPPSSSSSNNNQTFSSMNDKDLETIGAHCQYTYCNRLDFLPFRCESCRGTYCLDHRTETAHECLHAGEWAAARRKGAAAGSTFVSSSSASLGAGVGGNNRTATQCSHAQCSTAINTLSSVGVACPTCKRQYCLKHRLPEDHLCKTLPPLGGRGVGVGPSSGVDNNSLRNLEKARSALGRLRVWSKEKQANMLPKPNKPSSSSSSPAGAGASTAASRLLALNALKKTAKGDPTIPTEQRIYLYVEAEAEAEADTHIPPPKPTTTVPPTRKFPHGSFYYNRQWSVGRILDAAAKSLQVANLNNHGGGEGERLRVYHVEGGRVLRFGEKVGDVLGNGNRVVLLRGVGG